MDINLDELLIEWSYRTNRGYPKIDKPEDLNILKEIAVERYGERVAEKLVENIQDSLSEVSLGLNNSSLRHKNEHKKYNKRLIKKLKSGGKLEIEREVAYMSEDDDNPEKVVIPKGAEVKVNVQNDLIGKLVAALRGVLKHGPDFPEDNEEAQKALKRAEKVFQNDDGSYRRIVPIVYKGNEVLIKLSDVSKSTVTDEDEGQDTDYNPEDANSEEGETDGGSEDPESDQQVSEENLDTQEQMEENLEEEDNDNEFELPSGVVEFFGDSYDDGPDSPDVMDEDTVSEDSEDESGSEGHGDDASSKYVDRRDDGKDTKYPDREYKELDPESDEEEEAGDEDYRQSNGDEDENEEEETEEGGEEGEGEVEEDVKLKEEREIYRFTINR